MPQGPLAGLRVVDLTDDSGRFATKLLAESGASVVEVGVGFARAAPWPTPRPVHGAGCSTGGTTAASDGCRSTWARPPGRTPIAELARRRRADRRDRAAGGPGRPGPRPLRSRRVQSDADAGVPHAVRPHRPPQPLADERPGRVGPRRGAVAVRAARPTDQSLGPSGPQLGWLPLRHQRPGRRPGGPADGRGPARRRVAARGRLLPRRAAALPVLVRRPAPLSEDRPAPGLAPLDRGLQGGPGQGGVGDGDPDPQRRRAAHLDGRRAAPAGDRAGQHGRWSSWPPTSRWSWRPSPRSPGPWTPASCSGRPRSATSPSARCRPSPRSRPTPSTSSGGSSGPWTGPGPAVRLPGPVARFQRHAGRPAPPTPGPIATIEEVLDGMGNGAPRGSDAAEALDKPLGGLRVLDLSHVLAGPAATRAPGRPRCRRREGADHRAGHRRSTTPTTVLLRLEPVQAGRHAQHEARARRWRSCARSSSRATC